MKVLELTIEGRTPAAEAAEIFAEAEIETREVAPGGVIAPLEPGAYDAILAAHVLQTVPRKDVVGELAEWVQGLVPGGALHLVVPDMMWAALQMVHEAEADQYVMGVLYGSAAVEHRSGFTVGGLRSAMAAAGLATQQARVGPYELHGHSPEGEDETVIARQIYAVGLRRADLEEAEHAARGED